MDGTMTVDLKNDVRGALRCRQKREARRSRVARHELENPSQRATM